MKYHIKYKKANNAYDCNLRFVEFRYDLGSGLAKIRSPRRVTNGKWHKIQAKRWHKDGMLRLDAYDDVNGQSQGDLRSLDIGRESSFVGGLPDLSSGRQSKNLTRIATNLGFNQIKGFDGCIRKFKIGHREVKIQSIHEPLAIRRVKISECIEVSPRKKYEPWESENRCKGFCLNEGSCKIRKKVPFCTCKMGFFGNRCETNSKDLASSNSGRSDTIERSPYSAYIPLFTQSLKHDGGNTLYSPVDPSYLELPTLKHVSKAFVIEIWFLTRSYDGMLLYNGQTSNGNGDFVSLNLVNGLIQYKYDLGSGIANLTSGMKGKITLNEWHSVKITRNGPHGTLQVDGGAVVSGSSPAALTELNLETPLYLGGFK